MMSTVRTTHCDDCVSELLGGDIHRMSCNIEGMASNAPLVIFPPTKTLTIYLTPPISNDEPKTSNVVMLACLTYYV